MKVQPEVGKRYWVKTGTRRFRGKYMGTDIYGAYQFDLRPDFGTTTVHPADILAIEPTTRPGA